MLLSYKKTSKITENIWLLIYWEFKFYLIKDEFNLMLNEKIEEIGLLYQIKLLIIYIILSW